MTKTPHEWRASTCGYDPSDYCTHCGANNYDSYGTETCEDYAEAKQVALEKRERRHAPTEAAWTKLRSVLTREEWTLLELREKHGREFREKDYIKV